MQHTTRSWSAQTQEGLGRRGSQDAPRVATNGSASKSPVKGIPSHSQTTLVRPSSNGHISPLLHPVTSFGGQSQPPQRQPTLSLNTTDLGTSKHSTLSLSPDPPSPSSTSFPENLNSLRIGLDSVWQQSSKIFQGLYHTVTRQSDKIRDLTRNNADLQDIVTRQRIILQDIERQKVQQARTQSENQTEENNNKVTWEQTKLKTTNTRLWEDIMKLEGEKRELKAKVESQAEFVRLCQQKIQEERNRVAKKSNNNPEDIKVEEDEDVVGVNAADSILIPLSDVEERIRARLEAQATEHSFEINSLRKLLADYQLRTADLEAQLHSIKDSKKARRSNSSGSLNSDHYQSQQQSPGHANGTASVSRRAGLGGVPVMASPVTPQTSLSSATSEWDKDNSRKPFGSWKPSENHFELKDVHATQPTNQRASGSTGAEARQILQRRFSTPATSSVSSILDSIPTTLAQKSAPHGTASQQSVEMPPPPPPPPSYRQIPSAYCGPTAGWRPIPTANPQLQQSPHSTTAQMPSTSSQPLAPTHDFSQQPTQKTPRNLSLEQQNPVTSSPQPRTEPCYHNDSSSSHLKGQMHHQSQSTAQLHQERIQLDSCSPDERPKNAHSRSPSSSNGFERPKKRSRTIDGQGSERNTRRGGTLLQAQQPMFLHSPSHARRSPPSVDINQRPPSKHQISTNTNEIRTPEDQNSSFPPQLQSKTRPSQPVSKSTVIQILTHPPTMVQARQPTVSPPLIRVRPLTGTINESHLEEISVVPSRQNSTAPQPNQSSAVPPILPESNRSHGFENQTVHEMTLDEKIMFSSLSRVLVRKKEGENWRCALCKLEKLNPQATFNEATPIGGVTRHVKQVHDGFWREITQSLT